jgi:hypothetical protein
VLGYFLHISLLLPTSVAEFGKSGRRRIFQQSAVSAFAIEMRASNSR